MSLKVASQGLLVLSIFLVGCSPADDPAASATGTIDDKTSVMKTAAGQAPDGQLGREVEPVRYRLELHMNPREDRFSGTTEIDIQLHSELPGVWIHGRDLEVGEAWLIDAQGQRQEVVYEQRASYGSVRLSFERSLGPGPATLHFRYDAPYNRSLGGVTKAEVNGNAYLTSAFEAVGARRVFPGFDDPGFKVPFDVTIVTPAEDIAIAPTPMIFEETLADGDIRRVFDTTRPLPTYLMSFTVRPYDVLDPGDIPVNEIRSRPLPFRGLAARGQGEKMEYSLRAAQGVLEVLERYFDSAYPYQKLDLVAVPGSFPGALENVGAIVYAESLLIMNEQSPLSQRRGAVVTHAHELAHQWFGNLVTPRWWDDIWLNEAFANWIMYKTADAYWPEGEFDRAIINGAIRGMYGDSLAAAQQVREPIVHDDLIMNVFGPIIYDKGGAVLAMLERYVGEEAFRAGIQLHIERNADGTATTEDFIASVAEGSGRPEIEKAFMSFIEQPGVPLVAVTVECPEDRSPLLRVTQKRYAPLGSTIDPGSAEWSVPMCVSYQVDGSNASSCFMLAENEQVVGLESESCPTRLHPNADGAGYYRFSLEESAWQGLLAQANDLPAAEALMLIDSLGAGYSAGVVSSQTYLSGVATLVNHHAWDVSNLAVNGLGLAGAVLNQRDKESLWALQREIVGPRYRNLAEGSDSGTELLRNSLQQFLIVTAKDPAMRAPLAAMATARIGLGGEPDPDAAPDSQLETILSVGVQDVGEPFFDLLMEQSIASDEPFFRRSATGALARVEEPQLAARLRSAILEGKFEDSESTRMIARQLARSATTDETYEWVKNNAGVVFGLYSETFRAQSVPGIGSSLCSTEQARDWDAFIKSRADELAGYEQPLSKVIESINLCAGLKDAKSAEMNEAVQVMLKS